MSTVRADGTELFYRETGEDNPILLIHASGFDADSWRPELVEELARGHRVIAYDRRGYSRSGHPPIRDHHQHAEDAALLLAELDAAPATVVGYSSGGLTALDLTVGHPDLVTSLILVEPPLYGRKHLDISIARAFLTTLVLRRIRGDVAAVENFIRWTSGYVTGGTAWDEWPEERRNAVRSNATACLEEMQAKDPPNLAPDRLASVNCAVMCVTGELSQRWFHKTTRAVQDTIPQTSITTLTGVSHAMGGSKPVELARLIRLAASDGAGASST